MGQKVISGKELENEPYASMTADIRRASGMAVYIPQDGGIAEDVLAYLSENTDKFHKEPDFGLLLGSMVQEKAGTEWFAFVLEQYGGWEEAQRGFYAECVVLALRHGVPLAELGEKMSCGSDVYEIFEFADHYRAQSPDRSEDSFRKQQTGDPDVPADGGAGSMEGRSGSTENGEDDMEGSMGKQDSGSKAGDAGKIRECAGTGGEAVEMADSPESRYGEESLQGNTDMFFQYMNAIAGGNGEDGMQVMNLLRDTFGQAQKYLNEVFEIRRAEEERVRSLERVNTVQADRIRKLTERISLIQQENMNLRSRLSDAARNEKVSENIAQKLREIASMQESVTRSDFSGYLPENSGMGH